MKGKKNLGILAALLACFAISGTASFAADGFTTPISSAQRQGALDAYNRRPLSFEPNAGQTDARVRFLSRGPGYTLFLTGSDAVLSLQEEVGSSSQTKALPSDLNMPIQGKITPLRMAFVGANPSPKLVAMEQLPGTSNYMVGKDRSKWRNNIPTYAKVKYESIYPGVDLVYYGNQRQLEYDFVIAKGADPSRIRLAFTGAKALRVDSQTGDLLITTESGSEVRHVRPRVYQQVGHRQVEVAGAYHIVDQNQAAFTLAAYNRQNALVIDPTISFTRFLAGENYDAAYAVAVDSSGNAYVTGATYSTHFPLLLAVDSGYVYGTSNAFITKLSPTGVILFSTYWGGSKDWSSASGIAVDPTGFFICGSTRSADFPGSRWGVLNWNFEHAFVTKFSLDGFMIYSLVMGGTYQDDATAIAVDASHHAYVTGVTLSPDFPIVGWWQTQHSGAPLCATYGTCGYDAFAAKIDASGNLANSAFIGGSSFDWASGIAVDPSGSIWITGSTGSTDFPVTRGVSVVSRGTNVFVSRINSTFDGFVFSRVFGNGQSGAGAIAVDGSDYAYVTGSVGPNPGFPTTPGAFQTTNPSLGGSAFVTKLYPSGGIMYSTFLGGSNGSTQGNAIAVHGAGDVYVAGSTSSTSFPGAAPMTPNPTAGFLVKLTPQLNAINYTTLLGASINGVAIYQSYTARLSYPQVYTAGFRYTGAISDQAKDAFVVKLDETPISPTPVLCCAIAK